MPESNFTNDGIQILFPPSQSSEKTLIVVGIARGGTSLAAGALSHLGVFMGEAAHSPVFEDLRLSSAFENNDITAIYSIVSSYNVQHKTWGWKRPSVVNYLSSVHEAVRNPHYICLFKDLFSVANRNRISMESEVLKNMERSLIEYSNVVQFLTTNKPPCLMVSYDKALANKKLFIDRICEFAGIEPSSEEYQNAMNFITPSPKEYFDATRAGKIIGHIDVVSRNTVHGWAALSADTEPKPLTIILLINNKPIAELIADKYREDLLGHKVHVTGYAGFEFILDDKHTLKPGDIIRIQEKSSGVDLVNSPWTITEENTA
ncbi:MAG: hypothetical protein C0631_09435 [Sedimenticola sp.]|nr:MAG: hypothetical protein C0631_09435 [Sedimenticola sp.]